MNSKIHKKLGENKKQMCIKYMKNTMKKLFGMNWQNAWGNRIFLKNTQKKKLATLKTMTKKKKCSTIYAFIDSQNLNLGTSKNIYKNKRLIYKGWKLDFKKFRIYLSDKFRVSKAFLFIGYIEQNQALYRNLKRFGYELIFKPTVKDNFGKPKGNVDAELVLHAAAIEFSHYDKAVIVAGDGDYRCLHEYLIQYKKLLNIIIPNRKSESSLLKPFQSYKVFLVRDKDRVEFTNKNGRRGALSRR